MPPQPGRDPIATGARPLPTRLALPADWWGPVWNRGPRRTLSDLVADEVLDVHAAAELRSLVERGKSVTIAARTSGAGKTTLLTSLLDALPPERPHRFVRGMHDDLSGLSTTSRFALLVNEISPYLPIYCWGEALESVLRRVAGGDQLLATIHAGAASEIIDMLTSAPLRLPRDLVAKIGWVAVLEKASDGNRLGTLMRIQAIGG